MFKYIAEVRAARAKRKLYKAIVHQLVINNRAKVEAPYMAFRPGMMGK